MYKPSEHYRAPGDLDAKIWRYMTLDKFISMLDFQALWFSRGDSLGDPYEGAMSAPSVEELVAFFEELDRQPPYHPDAFEARKVVNGLVRQSYDAARTMGFFSCWHMNQHESMAMWSIYGDEGIAIQSTFRRLSESFSSQEERKISIGVVRYADHLVGYTGRSGWSAERSHFAQMWMTKGKAYEYEQEVRAVTVIRPILTNSRMDSGKLDHPTGVNVPVNLETLLEGIYVSPKRRPYFRSLVESVMHHYDCPTIPLNHSRLNMTPSWIASNSSL